MKYLAIALATAALTGAQTPAVSIRPHAMEVGGSDAPAAKTTKPGVRTGVPVLGYLAGSGPLDLRTILGTGKTAKLGPAVSVPAGVKHLFVPPREHYVLLESSLNEPPAVWLPNRPETEGTPVLGAISHPDVVSFSARGDAVALYGKASDHLQVVTGLPAEAIAKTQPGVSKFGEAANFAVSDDGMIVVAELTDGRALVSAGGSGWQRLPTADDARCALFVPKTHNLVVSDSAQQILNLLLNVGDKAGAATALLQGAQPDQLAVTKDGSVLLAASLAQNKLWTINLKTMTSDGTASSTAMDTLVLLRDGHTFLLSVPNLSLLNIPVDGDGAAGLVPVTR